MHTSYIRSYSPRMHNMHTLVVQEYHTSRTVHCSIHTVLVLVLVVSEWIHPDIEYERMHTLASTINIRARTLIAEVCAPALPLPPSDMHTQTYSILILS